MKLILKIVFIFGIVFTNFSQEDSLRYKSEIGIDGFVSASNLGGSFALGVKYAFVQQKKYVFGPSFRIQRMWSNFSGQKYGFNILGVGGFFHYRLANQMFVGAEMEFMRSPINYTYILSAKHWIPTCFVGGGYSHEFENVGIRINAGIFYDVINNLNSPFRTSYVLRKENGTLMPVIYRVGFFFPLN